MMTKINKKNKSQGYTIEFKLHGSMINHKVAVQYNQKAQCKHATQIFH